MEKLKIASVLASEILSREDLKKVFGGYGSDTGSSGSGIDPCAGTKSYTTCRNSNGDELVRGLEGVGCSRSDVESRCSSYDDFAIEKSYCSC